VKVNAPRNLSGFYLPNSQLSNGLSAPAIVLGPYNGNFPGNAVYRSTGQQPFTQYPFRSGNGSSFPGVGSIYGSILPGVVLQTALVDDIEVPTSYTLAPSYVADAPFINRTYGESSFSTFTVGTKIRFNNVNDPVGFGIVGYYRF